MSLIAATGVSHIALRVTDVDRAVAWYGEVLGYEVLWNGLAPTPDKTRSAMGLIAGGALALEFLATPGGKPWTVENLGVAGISITVPDIDAAVAAFNASPHGQNTRVFDAEDWRVAFLFDPDRNVVELVEQPQGRASIAAFAPELRRRRL
jgi:glyoxylase I family protein